MEFVLQYTELLKHAGLVKKGINCIFLYYILFRFSFVGRGYLTDQWNEK
jgi:hypothetical protein